MTERPFDESDFDPSLAGRKARVYNAPKPEHPLRETRMSDERLMYREAQQRDAAEAIRHTVHEIHDGPANRMGRLRERLSGPQFSTVPGLAEVHEAMRENPLGLTKAPRVGSIMDRPSERITQDNWQKGMGERWTERHFSPRRRAQGHLLGAAAMFAAAMPSLTDDSGPATIRY